MPSADTAYHLAFLTQLFSHISAALVLLFLLELGPGMHYAIDGVSRPFDRIIRYLAMAVAAIVSCIALAFYGLFVDIKVNRVAGYQTIPLTQNIVDRFALKELRATDDLQATSRIILFVVSLAITSLSIYVFIQRRTSPLRNVSHAEVYTRVV